jgi:4-aminobutyrate aminotransferase-like enzyme
MKNLVFLKEIQDITQRLSIAVVETGSEFKLSFTNQYDHIYWKGEYFSFNQFSFLWKESPHFRAADQELYIKTSQTWKQFQKTRELLKRFKDLLYRDNIQSRELWPDAQKTIPSGFVESQLETSQALLKEVYADGLLVPEKKGLVLDLDYSQGPNLIGIDPSHPGIIDAASQIASLAIGNNHPDRRSMFLRPEIRVPTLGAQPWDVKSAFARLLVEQSGLPEIRFVNSGAEAMECAVLSCMSHYPKRRKILAFNGSFHGRTLMALHATHSPAKRTPFEFFPERVEFLDFPENKDPTHEPADPKGWVELWSNSSELPFNEQYSATLAAADELLAEELRCLKAVRDSIGKETPICVLIEPMQCEGGERFATARFFRALRLLTRAKDVSLVFDEVQTGLGLGGTFFWFHQFGLKKKDGTPDFPDALYMAKKAQVGFAVSRFELPGCDETSPASLYRGYIQANEIFDWDASVLEGKVRSLLKLLQSGIGDNIVKAPRNKGLSFAFDLPSPEFLNEMIKIRFEHALLFYPAGNETARFRVTKDIRDEQLLQIFLGLFNCISRVAETKGFKPNMSLVEWSEELPEEWIDELPENPFLIRSKFDPLRPMEFDVFEEMKESEWDRCFKILFREVPQLLHSPWNQKFTLRDSPKSLKDLLALYKTHPEFTKLDLYWTASRFFGTKVRPMNPKEADSRESEVRALEELVYEAERVSPADFICAQSKNPESIVLLSEGHFGEIRGLSVAVPLHLCKEVAMVAQDPDAVPGSKVLYSYDLTIHPKHQGMGLGLRLKVEQYIEAVRIGAKKIKSRNRYPEAYAMDSLNHKLGAVTLAKNLNDYGGKATALYQSLNIPAPNTQTFSVKETEHGSMLNKMTLSNFVTPSFVYNTQILREFLPQELRHLYYASGRAECIEKSMRLLRYFRPKAKTFLSVEGDGFSYTTACGGSLGGKDQRLRFFDWPLVKSPEDLDRLLSSETDPESVFGFYVEPRRLNGELKSIEELVRYREVTRKHKIPLVSHESNSWGYRYSPKSFFACEGAALADVVVFFGGGQLGIVAASKAYFLDKNLMMISTWDGDDYSLSLFKHRLFEVAEKNENA